MERWAPSVAGDGHHERKHETQTCMEVPNGTPRSGSLAESLRMHDMPRMENTDREAMNMEARPRPPRKLFLSRKGKMSIAMTFLEEPVWTKDEKGREVLAGSVFDHNENQEARFEQYPPDAYDLSIALVKGLGPIVKGKRCVIRAQGAQRKTNDGKLVEFISAFEVEAVPTSPTMTTAPTAV
jgi:hypothetical protein